MNYIDLREQTFDMSLECLTDKDSMSDRQIQDAEIEYFNKALIEECKKDKQLNELIKNSKNKYKTWYEYYKKKRLI